MSTYSLKADPTHSVWDRTLAPRIEILPGDEIEFECVDSSGRQVEPGMSTADYLNIDRSLIHALTGPISISGANPGDVLEVQIQDVQHLGWGWSSIVKGLGLLPERFCQPYLFHWALEGNQTHSLSPAIVPLRPFLGVMGVAREECGSFRTRPPGRFGGNLDIRELCVGARLYLPVLVPGALFSCGDGHAAQGDGEVCINGIECPLNARLRFQLHKHQPLDAPLIESSHALGSASSGDEWIVVATGTDLLDAARAATSRMVDLLVSRWGFSDVHAYILCSVAMNLRLSQLVNVPVHTVCAGISKAVLPSRQLFATN